MNTALFTLLTAIVVVAITIKAFKDISLRDRLLFDPYKILVKKEWYRIISSGFIHLDTQHIIFNSITLLIFGQVIEQTYNGWIFLLVFLCSIVGGSIFSLFLHRHHNYQALGASGGTSGLVIAYVVLCPGSGVGLLILPGIYLPGFVYAFLFFAYSIYSHHRRHDNIGHDAHVGGGITGFILALIIFPQSIMNHPLEITGIAIFLISYLIYIFRSKGGLIPFKVVLKQLAPSHRKKQQKSRPPRSSSPGRNQMQKQMKVVTARKEPEIEKSDLDSMDDILKKISDTGMDSLSVHEKDILKSASKRLQDRKK